MVAYISITQPESLGQPPETEVCIGDDAIYGADEIRHALNYGRHPFSILCSHLVTAPFDYCRDWCDRALIYDLLSSFPTDEPIDALDESLKFERTAFFRNRQKAVERRFVVSIMPTLNWYFVKGRAAGLPISHFVSDVIAFVKFLASNVQPDRSGNGSIEDFIKERKQFWNDNFRTRLLYTP
jgi:hypothetical protein